MQRLEEINLEFIEGDGICLTPNRRQIKYGTKEKLVETLFNPGELNSSSGKLTPAPNTVHFSLFTL